MLRSEKRRILTHTCDSTVPFYICWISTFFAEGCGEGMAEKSNVGGFCWLCPKRSGGNGGDVAYTFWGGMDVWK